VGIGGDGDLGAGGVDHRQGAGGVDHPDVVVSSCQFEQDETVLFFPESQLFANKNLSLEGSKGEGCSMLGC